MAAKETTLERAVFALQLLMFFLSIFVSCCPRCFKLGQAECVQTMEAQSNQSRRQLFLF